MYDKPTYISLLVYRSNTPACMGMYMLELRNHTASVLSNIRASTRPNRAGVQVVKTVTAPVKPGSQGRIIMPLSYHAPTHYRTSTSAVLLSIIMFEGASGSSRVDVEDMLPSVIVAPAYQGSGQ